MEHKIKWTDEKIAKLWNFYSKTWPYNADYFSERFSSQILKATKFDTDSKIDFLDFGCGPGFFIDALSKIKSKWNYSGVDFSKDSVDAAITKGRCYKNFKEVGHITSMPTNLESDTYDVVFLIEVVEHLDIDQIDTTLNEIRRLLKPGGKLVITTPNREDLRRDSVFCPDCEAVFHKWQHIQSWSANSLNQVIEESGLRVRKTLELDFDEVGISIRAIFYRLKNMYLRMKKSKVRPHLMVVASK